MKVHDDTSLHTMRLECFATLLFMPVAAIIVLIVFCVYSVLECLQFGGVAIDIHVDEDIRWILLF